MEKIKRDLFNFFNVNLSNYIGYTETYTVDVDRYDDSIEITITSNSGISTLGYYWINPDEENEKLLNKFEDKVSKYFDKVPLYKADTLSIEYEPENIILRFRLK